MPTYPQVFHKDLFVRLLEKGIPEYQQTLSKGKSSILNSCTRSAKLKSFSSQPTRYRTLFPKLSTTNHFILNFVFQGKSPRSYNKRNAYGDSAHPLLPSVSGRLKRTAKSQLVTHPHQHSRFNIGVEDLVTVQQWEVSRKITRQLTKFHSCLLHYCKM